MAGEKPGSINSMAAESGRDPHDPAVFADFTHALGQWRSEVVAEDIPPTMEFAGLFLERHLGSSVRTLSDLQLEGDWQPEPTDVAAVRGMRLLSEEMVGLPPTMPQERHIGDS